MEVDQLTVSSSTIQNDGAFPPVDDNLLNVDLDEDPVYVRNTYTAPTLPPPSTSYNSTEDMEVISLDSDSLGSETEDAGSESILASFHKNDSITTTNKDDDDINSSTSSSVNVIGSSKDTPPLTPTINQNTFLQPIQHIQPIDFNTLDKGKGKELNVPIVPIDYGTLPFNSYNNINHTDHSPSISNIPYNKRPISPSLTTIYNTNLPLPKKAKIQTIDLTNFDDDESTDDEIIITSSRIIGPPVNDKAYFNGNFNNNNNNNNNKVGENGSLDLNTQIILMEKQKLKREQSIKWTNQLYNSKKLYLNQLEKDIRNLKFNKNSTIIGSEEENKLNLKINSLRKEQMDMNGLRNQLNTEQIGLKEVLDEIYRLSSKSFNPLNPLNPFAGLGNNSFGHSFGHSFEMNNVVDIDEEERNRQLMNDLNGGSSFEDDKKLQKLLDNIQLNEEVPEKDRASTPKGMTIQLLPHQRIGLTWLSRMEETSKGGILADDMGLGKTVQIIALILARPPEPNQKNKTTLIVTPVALLRQWENEILGKIDPQHRLNIYVHHSNLRRHDTFKEMSKYDIVLTTYNLIGREFKEHYKEVLAGGQISKTSSLVPDYRDETQNHSYDSPFFVNQAKWFRIVLDEAQIIKNKSTLASRACAGLRSDYRWCLSGTPMQNNVDELFSLVRFLKIEPYCQERKFNYDIGRPLRRVTEGYQAGPSRSTAMKKLQALLKAILLRRLKTSEIDGGPILQLPPRYIKEEKVIFDGEELEFYHKLENNAKDQATKYMNQEKGSGKNYSNMLVLLLRLRQACLHSILVEIGNKRQEVERKLRRLNDGPEGFGTIEKLIKSFKPEVVERILNDADEFTCPICLDVIDPENLTVFYPCGHGICGECNETFFDQFGEADGLGKYKTAKCLTCQMNIRTDKEVQFSILKKILVDKIEPEVLYQEERKDLQIEKGTLAKLDIKNLKPSPKISKCIELLETIKKQYPGEKSIIFSQFTEYFNILSKSFIEKNISYLQYDGSMSATSRHEVIETFYADPNVEVLLISLKAGNVGLTLTCASHVIITDPFWNPFVEDQAMDRAHRIGQKKPVTVYRLLIENTVEDRILALQKGKRDLIQGALDEGELRNIGRLGRKELGYLFGLNLNYND